MSVLRQQINRRAAEWSLFIGAFWATMGAVAAWDPVAQGSQVWQPLLAFTGSLTVWVVAWFTIGACGTLAYWSRLFAWHVVTQGAAIAMSAVWVGVSLATRHIDDQPVSYGAVILWGFPGLAVLLFAVRGASPTRTR